MSCYEDFEDSAVFEKPRGNHQSKQKLYHGGEKRCYDSVKDREFLEKIVVNPTGKKEAEAGASNDNLKCNVMYSMNKKNRFRDVNTVGLLRNVTDGMNAEVVEKNTIYKFDKWLPNHTTFAVHTKVVEPNSSNLLDFEIDSVTSSGMAGQDHSNFRHKNRQSTKKAEVQEESEKPTVSYNVYRTYPSPKGVGSHMFQSSKVPKTNYHRTSKRIDKDQECYINYMCIEDSVVREFLSDDEESAKEERFLNLGDLRITERPNQRRKRHARKNNLSECSSQFEFLEIPTETQD